MKKLKVCKVNFWSKAFTGDFFAYLLDLATNASYDFVEDVDSADVVFSSVFGKTAFPPQKTIMYLGENIRPNLARYRYALSFDSDPYGGFNCLLPLWYARLAWPGFTYINTRLDEGSTHGHEELIPLESLVSHRSIPKNHDSKSFCVLVAGNPEGLRCNLYLAISRYKKVDGYGMMFNRPLLDSKFAILDQYRFCLCPENSYFDGYITEKLFDAWHGGCIPIWYGPTGDCQGLNHSAFLNYANTFAVNSLVHDIQQLDQHLDQYSLVYSQPLLNTLPDLDPVLAFLRGAIHEIAG